jgi:predicted hotdog family 3-hydroxylacyl-ACP dehydratase
MTARAYPAVGDVLPHTADMVLLTRIVGHTDDRTTCAVEIGPDTAFRDAGGSVPAWVGLEYMAQCIAAHGGLRARAAGDPVTMGFLLGGRSIALHTPAFTPGQTLQVDARHVWGSEGFFSFACTIRDTRSGDILVEGNLSVVRSAQIHTLTGERATEAR